MINFKIMFTYVRAQAAAIIGSIADFLVSIIFVHVFHCWYIQGNAGGNIIGSVVQFILSRNWVFKATNVNVYLQIVKYVLFWSGNILLQAAGVYFFMHYFHPGFILSKIITSVIIGLSYNYLIQKKFVFA
ncbi:MAG TPA: GtrA family protein [Puia sp.]|nr:GtrA family protein [Puia sp.]